MSHFTCRFTNYAKDKEEATNSQLQKWMDLPFELEEIKQALATLKKKSAPSLDQINNRILLFFRKRV